MPMEGRAGLGLTARKLGGKGTRCETSVMWYAKAEGTMQCTKCGRDIPRGAACLSQLPCDLPAGIHRSGYMNFCIHCFEWSSGGPPEPGCTLSREHLQQVKTEASVSCHYCQETISPNAEAFVWTFFDWPKSSRSRSDPVARNLHGGTGAAPWIGGWHRGKGGWDRLSPDTQRQFRTRGLGRGLGSWTLAKQRRLYESIPQSIRNAGDKGVQRFLRRRHASHIESVKLNPGRGKDLGNIVWEDPGINRRRGAQNMTKAEFAAAKASNRRAGYAEFGKSVGRQVAWTAAIELFVAGLENWFHWKRGRKTGKQAVGDATRSTGASLWTTVVMTAVASLLMPVLTIVALLSVALGLILVSSGPVWHAINGAQLATPLTIGGIVLIVLPVLYAVHAICGMVRFPVNTVRRLARAARYDDFPLDELRVYFCLPCTLQNKARKVGNRPGRAGD